MKHLTLSYDAAWHGLVFAGLGAALLLLAVVALVWAGLVGLVSLFKKKE